MGKNQLYILGIIFVFASSISAHAMVFGTDHRVDYDQISDSVMRSLGKSVFTFVLKQDLVKTADGNCEFAKHDTLRKTLGLCSGERFGEQTSVPTRCSGFLISSDLGVTAGHCVSPLEVKDFCKNYFIVFDYDMHPGGRTPLTLSKSSVHECDKIASLAFDPNGRTDDYAVLHFSRPVKHHPPLKYRKMGKIADRARVFMIGYPRGLPEKFSLDRKVSENSDPSYFSADLDCFHGNSGSPVFNSKTLEVEGIFVRGEGDFPGSTSNPEMIGDFVYNDAQKCYRTLVCRKSNGCTATMDSTRITRVPLLKLLHRTSNHAPQAARSSTARGARAQDKYDLKVPGELAFSEFRGYEGWSVISVSENGGHMAAILGNPIMIAAYRAGVPGNGKPFPDGAKMAKIHWTEKKLETFPAATVPATQHDVDFMEKDSKRFADSSGWGWAVFDYEVASDTFSPGTTADSPPQDHDAKCGFACHTIVKSRDYVFTSYAHR